MGINRKILIAIVGMVFVAAAGTLVKLGGIALWELYPRNAAHQAAPADVAKDVQYDAHQATASVAEDAQDAAHQAAPADAAKGAQDAAHQATPADIAKDVQAMKHETRLPKALDNYTELVDIRADGQAVVFVHRLAYQAEPAKAYQFLAAVRTNMLRPVCSQQKMAKAINQGVVFRYQYDDAVGFNVGSFDIGGNDCTG
jgi:hypothetical protein